jgi:hypothetical protein
MKRFKWMLIALVASWFVFLGIVEAGDFDWMKDFNIKAEADMAGFRARLAARFKIGEAQVNTVLSHVERPADAYMVFRLGEMAQKPTDIVIEKYKSQKGKGWGELAKSLGIKPGSKEFHALKRGSDFYNDHEKGKGKEKSKGKH